MTQGRIHNLDIGVVKLSESTMKVSWKQEQMWMAVLIFSRRIANQPLLTMKRRDTREDIPHLHQLWEDLLDIIDRTWPCFYSQIHNAAYVVVVLLEYVPWELSDYIHIISKSMNKKFFIKYVPKFAATNGKICKVRNNLLNYFRYCARSEIIYSMISA